MKSPRFHEPLLSGPNAGKAADKTKVKEDTKIYYKQTGG